MTNAAHFWDKVAPKYAKDAISDMAAYEYTLGRTLSYLTPDDRVLELGCGTGSTAVQIAPHVREIVGTDVSPKMIEIAKSRASDAGVRTTDFRVATATVSTQENGFPAVLAHNLFHLVEDAERVFANIHTSLPNGSIFISKTACLSDPSFGFKRYPIKLALPIMRLIGKAPYVRFLTNRELEAAITFAGSEIIESGNFPATSRYIVAKHV